MRFVANYFQFPFPSSFPRFSRNLKSADSSECCASATRKPRKALSRDFSRRVKTDSVHARRRFKGHSRVCHLDRENRREHGLCAEQKVRGEHRRFSGKAALTSPDKRAKQTDVGSKESDEGSLNGKNRDAALEEEGRTRAKF